MKKCRWNIRRSVWAFFIILCCHGNFADDPVLALLQSETVVNVAQVKDQATVRDTPMGVSSVLPESQALEQEKMPSAIEEPVLFNGPLSLDEDAVDTRSQADSPVLSLLQAEPQSSSETAKDAVVEETVTKQQSSEAESAKSSSESSPLSAAIVNRIQLPDKITNSVEDSWSLQDNKGDAETDSNDPVTSEAKMVDTEAISPETVTESAASESSNVAEATNDSEEKLKETAEVLAAVNNQELKKVAFSHEVDSDPDQLVVDSGTPSTEDMPSFNEWTKKRLEEQVKHGQHPQSTASQQGKVSTKQMRHKNYASIDCGAKVISANPEAQSTAAVLTHYRDDYMLNPCTAKIWLIIELCESIQADRIDLANYELFSSSPREFSVYSSDRFPARDWTFLGAFEAKDERSVQNFTIDHNTFGKYIKVEMGSHYGSEHFCPLSLVRVFGTSEYEALETEDRADESIADDHGVHDPLDDDDLLNEQAPSQEPKNLFGSATDAVINIVKKAAEVLRSDKSEPVVTPEAPPEHSSVPDNHSQLINGPSNCICLQRLPPSDCEQDLAATDTDGPCRRQTSIAQLECSYSELYRFLVDVWPQSFRGVFSKKCSSFCKPFLVNCDASSTLNEVDYGQGACRFFRAVFGSVRFGALCQLDRLLLDERRKVPIVKPRCRYPNETASNVSLPNLDFIRPRATPPISIEMTSSPAAFENSSPLCVAGYACMSGDQGVTCLTQSNVVPPPASDSCKPDSDKPVIKTGAIAESGDAGDELNSDVTKKSQISPTKTLPDDVKLLVNSNVLHSGDHDRVMVAEGDASGMSSNAVPVPFSIVTGKVSLAKDAVTVLVSSGQPSKPLKSVVAVSEETETSETTSNGSINAVLEESAANFPEQSEQLSESVVVVPSMSATVSVQSDVTDRPSNGDHFLTAGGLFGMDASSDPLIDSESVTLDDDGTVDIDVKGSILVTATTPRGGKIVNGQGGALASSQKESVFVRLSNRIKALELNMSLSGQYLEELSRRYRKQMEEMQKAFNRTIGALNETARKAYERDMRQQELIRSLQAHLENVSKVVLNLEEQQESLHASVVSRHIVLMIIEVLVISALFLACTRTGHQLHNETGEVVSVTHSTKSRRRSGSVLSSKYEAQGDDTPRRRNSDSNVGSLGVKSSSSGVDSGQQTQDKRRASTDALNVSGTYSHLLLDDPSIPVWVNRPSPKEIDHPKKKKRQRNKGQGQGKAQLYRSVSSNILPSNCSQKPPKAPLSRKNSTTNVSSAGLLFASTDDSRQRIQDFVPLKRKDCVHVDYVPVVRNPLERISTATLMPKQQHPNRLNGSIHYPPLSNLLINGSYAPELPSKSTMPRKVEPVVGSVTLNSHRLQRPLPLPPPRNDFTLKKVTEQVCG